MISAAVVVNVVVVKVFFIESHNRSGNSKSRRRILIVEAMGEARKITRKK